MFEAAKAVRRVSARASKDVVASTASNTAPPITANTSSSADISASTAPLDTHSSQPDPGSRPSPDPSKRPPRLPGNARFSSGPCCKHPGWKLDNLDTQYLGRSHRASGAKARLQAAIERSANLMGLPEDWVLGIVPGSDTGAFEMAMWSMLGSRPVTALVWESFSSDWAADLELLGIDPLEVRKSAYGELPELDNLNPDSDVIFVYNGTTSGVCLPNLDFVPDQQRGLVLCDATSALFSTPLDYSKLDVVSWSWQKVLGGEAAHGMLALSPRAIARLQEPAPRALPKLFRLTSNGKLNQGIFSGATINTPSMLAVEDLHSALDWADSIGGSPALLERSQQNFNVIDSWVRQTPWVKWLPGAAEIRSTTSMCLSIVGNAFTALPEAQQKQTLKDMLAWLDREAAAYDIGNYRSAPTGFRIWGGATVESEDLTILTQWLDHVYWLFESGEFNNDNQENSND